jgi:hypothetical protein
MWIRGLVSDSRTNLSCRFLPRVFAAIDTNVSTEVVCLLPSRDAEFRSSTGLGMAACVALQLHWLARIVSF